VLGQEINHIFTKFGNNRALIMSRPLLLEYYYNMDYDWHELTLTHPRNLKNHEPTQIFKPNEYTKSQVPINKMIPASGTPLGYRLRTSGDNQYPFDMFIITWQPGQYSGIHYHPVFGCSYLVLQGKLLENLYVLDPTKTKMKKTGCRVHSQGTAGYIDNNIGAHQIINNFTTPAVSLHIYSPRGAQVRNLLYNAQTNIDDIDN
jgi:hypothetical protein